MTNTPATFISPSLNPSGAEASRQDLADGSFRLPWGWWLTPHEVPRGFVSKGRGFASGP